MYEVEEMRNFLERENMREKLRESNRVKKKEKEKKRKEKKVKPLKHGQAKLIVPNIEALTIKQQHFQFNCSSVNSPHQWRSTSDIGTVIVAKLESNFGDLRYNRCLNYRIVDHKETS